MYYAKHKILKLKGDITLGLYTNQIMISITTSLYRSDKYIEKFCTEVRKVSAELSRSGIEHQFIFVLNDATPAERAAIELLVRNGKVPTKSVHCPRESIYASWNRGVRESEGDIVTFWNVDDIRNAEAIIDGSVRMRNGIECVYFPFIYKRYIRIFGLNILAKSKIVMPAEFDISTFKSQMHAGPFFMIKKESLERIGGFDESFTIAGDFECMTRAADKITFERSDVIAGTFTNNGRTLSGSRNAAHAQENFRITGKDIFAHTFGLDLMDIMHEYPDTLGNVRYYHRLKGTRCADFISRHAGPDRVFLDAGAGRGPYSLIAKDLYQKVYCYEYDKSELDAARNHIHADNVEFSSVDLTAIPLPDDSVDVIVCSEVLEHIPDNKKAVSELYRVLKNDGSLLVSMPNRFSLFYQKVYMMHRKSWFPKPEGGTDDPHFEARRHIEYPFWKIEDLLKTSAFKIVGRTGANIIPLPDSVRKKMALSYPSFFKTYVSLEQLLSSRLPWLCSFYFVELKK
jgi:SAM-dependent methyltransferase